jgi:hypothetical protein
VSNVGALLSGEMGKGNLLQIVAQDETTKAPAKVCRLADKKVHTDTIVDSDDGGPNRLVDIAITLEVSERSAIACCEMADIRRLPSDEWPVLGGNIVQRDGSLLIKPLDVRLFQPSREDRKVRPADRAKADAFQAVRRLFVFLNAIYLALRSFQRKER